MVPSLPRQLHQSLSLKFPLWAFPGSSHLFPATSTSPGPPYLLRCSAVLCPMMLSLVSPPGRVHSCRTTRGCYLYLSGPRDFVRNAETPVPPGTHGIRICISTTRPGDRCAHLNLRGTGPCIHWGKKLAFVWKCLWLGLVVLSSDKSSSPVRWQVPHLARSHQLREAVGNRDGEKPAQSAWILLAWNLCFTSPQSSNSVNLTPESTLVT